MNRISCDLSSEQRNNFFHFDEDRFKGGFLAPDACL